MLAYVRVIYNLLFALIFFFFIVASLTSNDWSAYCVVAGVEKETRMQHRNTLCIHALINATADHETLMKNRSKREKNKRKIRKEREKEREEEKKIYIYIKYWHV